MDLKILANAIKDRRIEKGLSRTEMEKLTGISRHTIKNYEEGRVEPGISKYLVICDVLGIDLKVLDEASQAKKKEYVSVQDRLEQLEKKLARLGENKRRLALC